ncbi:PhiH1 repressor-like protein [Haloferax mediterranei ATCC 33500]|uniref:PhiH1 repressor-like protein n=1 Tax=Haloferax mediterranei (strain ATCC 33500 / DSM 1411 / JCM 8866 / NBRC 14739 / NCIMB 2177 / R-4) TaxID=523841 RepID=I3R304_HALMT|nr:PhiH1 repressor-like protein [Haloferax mediterranei ATCC 33500]
MTKYGLVTWLFRGLYAISDDGLTYLDEELDASTLEPAEDE